MSVGRRIQAARRALLALCAGGTALTWVGCEPEGVSVRPAAVRDGCRILAAAVRDAVGVVPREGVDEDAGSTGPRCTVDLEIETPGTVLQPDPAETVRAALFERGWSEDLLAAADGPGTTAFAFTSGVVRCAVSAGQPSWLEDDSVHVSATYYLKAHCSFQD